MDKNPVRELLDQLVQATELVGQTKQALDTALMLQANKTGEVIVLLTELGALADEVPEEVLDVEPERRGEPEDPA